jgi:hypothetical protein
VTKGPATAKGRTTRSRGRAPAQKRELIPLAQLLVRLALSRKQVQREVEEGMPHERGPKNALRFPWPDCRIWRDEKIRERATIEARPTNAKDSRDRKEAAEAELAELKVQRERGALIPIDVHERLMEDAFARVRARLLGLPPRLGAMGVGHKTPREAQAALEPVISEVMGELHRAEDVPFTTEADDDGDGGE